MKPDQPETRAAEINRLHAEYVQSSAHLSAMKATLTKAKKKLAQENAQAVDADVVEIIELHGQIESTDKMSLGKAIRIGELLTARNKKCAHGEWLPWLRANVPFKRSTAYDYMTLYENKAEISSAGNLRQALRLIKKKSREKAGPGPELQSLVPKGHSGIGRLQYLYENGEPELIEAYEGRQISLRMADFLAHLEPDNQREEIGKFVVGKDKVVVLPATEKLLVQKQREEVMKAQVIAMDGLNEFQRAFRLVWEKLVRKFQKEYPGDYGYGEMWRLAEAVVIRVNAPQQEIPQNPS